MSGLELLFGLLVGHAIADFALQTPTMAKFKNWNTPPEPPPGQKMVPCWPYWLGSHALIHGGAVYVVTGIWWLGLIETVLHAFIDAYKCAGWYGPHTDQALHVACKLYYVALIWALA